MKKILISLSVLLLSFSCGKNPSTKQETFEYEYQVFGVNSGNLTVQIINDKGTLETFTNVSSGWSTKWKKTLMVDENNQPVKNAWSNGPQGLSILATDVSLKSTSITVKILRQGMVVSENTESNSEHSAKTQGLF